MVEPGGSNRRPPACKAGALPAELWPRDLSFFRLAALVVRSLGHVQFVHSRRSLTSRLASQKKSCVTTVFVDAENSITVLFNPNCAPFCTDQGKFDRRLLTINKGGFNARAVQNGGSGKI